ncbi:MAG: alkaline phosphatase family protein [Terriglobales bacterium]
MKAAVRIIGYLLLLVTMVAHAQIFNFRHIVVIVQENRTPDNLFQGLCVPPYGGNGSCSTAPTGSQYDVQTRNWLDKKVSGGVIQPGTVPLANNYDLSHTHPAFTAMCDATGSGVCRMDGAAGVHCSGTCPGKPQFRYVDNSSGILNPYLELATQYGWANYMFQTNQGPSFPAHQFLFGGTSAPSAADDRAGIFASENMGGTGKAAGCIADAGTTVQLITPTGENQSIYPCFEHWTMADLFDSRGISWKYYAPSAGSIWTAPDAIKHICQPDMPTGGHCTGVDWTQNVVLTSAQVLTDVSACDLADVTWVIPRGQNSDHANSNTGGGPSWVASIVNAIGNNSRCSDGELYWHDTAIFITWDDWGGWYDHEPPTVLSQPQGDYQYGFRVPLIVVSAYTPAGYVNNDRYDFGSILRFIEQNFRIPQGALQFADARAKSDLTGFFHVHGAPRSFQAIAAPKDAKYFVNDKSPPEPPDND